METGGIIYPKSNYEMVLTGDAHRLFTDRGIVFNKPPNALGEVPDYLRPKHGELVRLELLREAMSRYPYIATGPGGFIRQIFFEIAQGHLDDPEVVVVNGKPYQTQKQNKTGPRNRGGVFTSIATRIIRNATGAGRYQTTGEEI